MPPNHLEYNRLLRYHPLLPAFIQENLHLRQCITAEIVGRSKAALLRYHYSIISILIAFYRMRIRIYR